MRDDWYHEDITHRSEIQTYDTTACSVHHAAAQAPALALYVTQAGMLKRNHISPAYAGIYAIFPGICRDVCHFTTNQGIFQPLPKILPGNPPGLYIPGHKARHMLGGEIQFCLQF